MGGLTGGLFGGGVKAPKPTPISPIPTSSPETGEDAMASILRKSGYSKTILTGALSPKSKGLKTTLG